MICIICLLISLLTQARAAQGDKVTLAVDECKRRHRALLAQLAEQEKLERAQWQAALVDKLRKEAETQVDALKRDLKERRDKELEVRVEEESMILKTVQELDVELFESQEADALKST